MKKVLALFLVFCMMIPLAACGTKNDPGKTTDDVTTTVEPVSMNEEEKYLAELPTRDYEWADFNVLVTTAWQNLYLAENDSGDQIEEAAYKRNVLAEDNFGVMLKYNAFNGDMATSGPLVTSVRTADMNGTPYDIVMAQTNYLMPLVSEGFFQTINDNPYINLDKPWYHQHINENATIGGKQYCFSGDFIISQTAASMIMFFNKNMYKNLGYEDDLYSLVEEHEWTFEKLKELVSDTYFDLNQSGTVDGGDSFGLVGPQQIATSLMAGMGYHVVEYKDNGLPTIDNYLNGKTLDIFDKMLSFINERDEVYWKPDNNTAVNLLLNNQSLFCIMSVQLAIWKEYRDSTISIGVLPMPLYDNTQDNYYTIIQRREMMFISANTDQERAGILAEYLNYASWKYVQNAYWDRALLIKGADTENDMKMYQIQHAGVLFDFTAVFSASLGGIDSLAEYLVLFNKNELSSTWESKKDLYKEGLQLLIDSYLEEE